MQRILGLLLVFLTSLAPFEALAQDTDSTYFSRSKGRELNPAIGLNLLGLHHTATRAESPGLELSEGFSIQEAELQFTADVDPYFRALGLFSIHAHHEEAEEEEPHATEYSIAPEELYFETMGLPLINLRLGKFYTALTRHNTLHTHAFPFIDAPLANQVLLGEEGLNEVGASASIFVPLSWFSELNLQALSAENPILFGSESESDIAGLLSWKNLWELSPSLTVQTDLSGAYGNNSFGGKTSLIGADLIFKWRPTVQGRYSSWEWATQYIGANREGAPEASELGGLASWLRYQFAQRWWIQIRGELLGLPRSSDFAPVQKQSLLLSLVPSEFSTLRAQLDHINGSSLEDEYRLSFQWNMSIGAHPAHLY